MNLNRKNLGFTLIELLVVVAIIGISASVVLASLNTARGKGADAAIKANMANLRAQAEMYYDTNGSYGGTGGSCVINSSGSIVGTGCVGNVTADPIFQAGLKAAAKASGGSSLMVANVLAGTAPAWAAQVPLSGSISTKQWCVDSTGVAKQVSVALNGTAC